jgi:L-lactate dehydrogenase complex protein LldF
MPSDFTSRADIALNDAALQEALARATGRFLAGRERAWRELDDIQALRDRGRAIRDYVLDHLDDLLAELEQQITAAGGVVHHTADTTAACRIIVEIAQAHGVQLAVKSKSMTSEEVHLNTTLAQAGVEAVETDLGEWIVQLAGEPPSHIIAPAVHKTKSQVATLFAQATGETMPDDIPALTQVARRELRRRFLSAGLGISGVNFAVAETGTLVVVTNEGNGRLVTSLPPLHVALMGIEKVVPTWDDLAVLLTLLTRSATGQRISSYVTAVTGPRRAGEADGPAALHLVILDNGRRRILASDYRESLRCLRCGACLNACPVYNVTGGHAYDSTYSGPIGAVQTPLLQGLAAHADLPHASSLCGACLDACPVQIDIPRMLLDLRHETAQQERGMWPGVFRLYRWVAQSQRRYRLALRLAYWLSRPLARNGWLRALPGPLGRWTAARDLHAPARRSFHDRWRTFSAERPQTVGRARMPAATAGDGPPTAVESRPTMTIASSWERFAAELAQVGGATTQAADRDDAARQIVTWAQAHHVERVIVCVAPETEGISQALLEAGFEVEEAAPPGGVQTEEERQALRDRWARADLVISGADAAIAATGTLVLAAQPALPRAATVLPPLHVALLDTRRIVPTFADLMTGWRRERLPSGLFFVTGPSRTGDIEQTLTIGVHGPGELFVIGLQQ